MQDIFNTVKGKALTVAEYLTPVLKESHFLETGVLTPEEFIAAGDHLTHHCPTWRWVGAAEGYTKSYLPPEKQYLITKNVPCYRRVKQMEYQGTECMVPGASNDEEGWVDTHADYNASGMHKLSDEVHEMRLTDDDEPSTSKNTVYPSSKVVAADDEDEDDDDDEVLDMDEYFASGKLDEVDEQTEKPSVEALVAEASQEQEEEDEILATRTYDLHITYDKYYQTPRLWVTGYDEHRTPLTVDAMYEDFSPDHANKTITVEVHPHLSGGPPMASVHPCKHADTMKKICQTVTEGGGQLEVHLYLIVFLKFMQAIIPTIEYDFTRNFSF